MRGGEHQGGTTSDLPHADQLRMERKDQDIEVWSPVVDVVAGSATTTNGCGHIHPFVVVADPVVVGGSIHLLLHD